MATNWFHLYISHHYNSNSCLNTFSCSWTCIVYAFNTSFTQFTQQLYRLLRLYNLHVHTTSVLVYIQSSKTENINSRKKWNCVPIALFLLLMRNVESVNFTVINGLMNYIPKVNLLFIFFLCWKKIRNNSLPFIINTENIKKYISWYNFGIVFNREREVASIINNKS